MDRRKSEEDQEIAAFEGQPLDDENFYVDIDGYEGPLDLLLDLARRQKVDLSRISILALAEQYLRFVEVARRIKLELAADYLVMAAWLAYLKSRLLLPAPPKGAEPDPNELAANLAQRLRRLQAIRVAAEKLMRRPQEGIDVFGRGAPEGLELVNAPLYQASLYDLLAAYARQRQIQALSIVSFRTRQVWSLAEARVALERIIGVASDWTSLDGYLLEWLTTPEQARTVRASTFSASLEMVKEGLIDLRQDRAFAPLWVKRREPTAETAEAAE